MENKLYLYLQENFMELFLFKKKSLLGLSSVISSEKVAASKYIKHNDEIIGYYSGHTFANQIGVSLQVPMVKEIISNKCSAIVRTVKLNKKNDLLRYADNFNSRVYKYISILEL